MICHSNIDLTAHSLLDKIQLQLASWLSGFVDQPVLDTDDTSGTV